MKIRWPLLQAIVERYFLGFVSGLRVWRGRWTLPEVLKDDEHLGMLLGKAKLTSASY